MADHFQFEAFRPSANPECRHCEELLADAVDDLLAPADQVFFDRHIATCADCAAAFADAGRGAAWLEMLKTPRPEPSAQLFERIIAQTSGAQTSGAQTSGAQTTDLPLTPHAPELPAYAPAARPLLQPAGPVLPQRVLPFRPRVPRFSPNLNGLNRLLFEPRLAMTAAMAFFSVALTLNLAGVHLNQLHAQDLGPAGIRRSYFQATASVARRYEGLRVVHTFESRVDDLRQNDLNPDDGAGNDLTRPSQNSGTESRPDQPAKPTPQPAKPQPATPEPKQSHPEGGVSQRLQPGVNPRLLSVADGKLQTTVPAPPTAI